MKKVKIKQVIYLLGFCVFLMGCDANQSLSLEEALLQSGQEVLSQEAKVETEKVVVHEQNEQKVVVYVCGCVNAPGVYELVANNRIVAAIEAAGGFTLNAATEAINLAEPLQDGMQIYVPSMEEVKEASLLKERAENGLVNINKATEEELCTLPGIGDSKAISIVKHREEHGLFQRKEDIRNVSGIGDGLYAQIEDKIYIE